MYQIKHLQSTSIINEAIILIAFFFACSFFPSLLYSQCNGSIDLCNKRYDQVMYVTTHNAYNTEADMYLLPNHYLSISQQLEDGVRALMLDIYTDPLGQILVYHSSPILGSRPLADVLDEVYQFMSTHPTEIITFIFESDSVAADDVEMVLSDVGLFPWVYTHDLQDPWPTLQTLIDNNNRLVILTDDVGGATLDQAWYHYVWSHAVETHFSNMNLNSFNCNFNRGEPENALFILNHFITSFLGVGAPIQAAQANSNPFFIDRALECWDFSGKIPNFLTVDFHDLGDPFFVADSINNMIPVPCNLPISNDGFQINNCQNPVQLSWNEVEGAVAYEFFGHRAGFSNPQLSRVTNDPFFNFNGSVPDGFNVEFQLRAQCANGIWSDWTPLSPYTIDCSNANISSPIDFKISLAETMHEVKIYPNPATNFLTLEIPFEGPLDMTIYSTSNQLVKQQLIYANKQKHYLDIADLKQGFYILHLIHHNRMITKNFIKL